MGLSFHIKSSVLPDQATVVAFRGSEGISRPYVFDIYVEVTGPLDIEMDDAPGAKATLTIENGDTVLSSYSGIVGQFELLRAINVSDTSRALYLLRLVPHFWALSLTRHSRIFTKQSLPDVIKAVLGDEGIQDFEFRINGSYEEEEHITQYKESSLDFIQRWTEREGLFYFFEQSEDGEKLIITDKKSAASALCSDPIRYQPHGGGDGSSGIHFETFIARNRSLPATVKFTDYDYSKPQLDVKGSSKVSPNGMGDVVTYGNRFFTPDKGNALAAIRADDLRARGKNFFAAGPAPQIMAGYPFSVDLHPKGDFNTEYLAVTVEHFYCLDNGKSWGSVLPFDHQQEYRCEVTAILASQQYRHPETVPWPRIDGFENANVDGPASSEYAQIDDQGRYAVKFKFDEGTLKDGKGSTWVRKMQPHAGAVEGWHFPERKGTEVVCAFLGGDPDRPVIVGAIPTAVHPSPVTSSNHTKNVIQTGGRNRFEMEDQDGSQRVTISTPHAKTFIHIGAGLEGLSQVYSGEGTIPDHQMAIHTEGNSLINTCGTYDIETGVDWNVVIANDHHEQIGGNRVDEVTGFMQQEIGQTLLQEVQGEVTEAYHSTLEQGVQGAVTLNHMTSLHHGIGAEAVGGATHMLTVEGTQAIHVTDTQEMIIDGEVSWTTKTAEWKITGDLEITATGHHKIESSSWHENTLGPKSELIAGWKNENIFGICTETLLGGKLEINAAFVFEFAPEKTHINLCRWEVAAEHAEAHALKERLKGLDNEVAGLKTYDAALLQGGTALTSKLEALESTVGTLKSSVAALHSKA
ncbi:MAG: type VI secretion system tip protein TssI/VgrG [Polyangiaceae bacterium]